MKKSINKNGCLFRRNGIGMDRIDGVSLDGGKEV